MASIWREKNGEETRRPQLAGDMETEAAIIGGGLTGVLLAYRLRERGIACCVLEADAVGSGTTGGSTGKVTAQHEGQGICPMQRSGSGGVCLSC